MVEVMASSLIVGVMLVAALNTVGMAARTRRINANRLVGPGLAQNLLSEIMSRAYCDPDAYANSLGVDAGESAADRTHFDDVDDYDNYAASPAKGRDGVSLGLAGWSQSVDVAWANRTTGAGGATSDTGLKRIVVTITGPGGATTVRVGLRSKAGALEQPLPASRSAVAWMGAELRVGSAIQSSYAGAAPANHTRDAN